MTTKKIIVVYLIATVVTLAGVFIFTATSLPKLLGHTLMVVGIILNVLWFVNVVKKLTSNHNNQTS